MEFIIRRSQGRNFWGTGGGGDTPWGCLAGQRLFLHGKMPENSLRCDDQKYETGFEKKLLINNISLGLKIIHTVYIDFKKETISS